MNNLVVEKIIREIETFAPAAESEHVGAVTAVGDGVVAIDGLGKAVMSEIILFEEGEGTSIARSIEGAVGGGSVGDRAGVAEGMTVKSTGRVLSVPSGEELLGRVVNALGEPLDGKGPFKKTTLLPVERQASGVIDRRSVSEPVPTGIKAIDALIPIDRKSTR